jgi:ribosome maturation factor RimP
MRCKTLHGAERPTVKPVGAIEPAAPIASAYVSGYTSKAVTGEQTGLVIFPVGLNRDGRFALFLFVGLKMDIERLVDQVVSGLGYELVDFETSPKGRLMRIFIDVERGITVEDCAAVSNQVSRVFEVENVDYDRLEVSSPGLDRPLKKLADFQRFSGSEVQVRLRMPVANQRNFAGVLNGVVDGEVHLSTGKGEVAFPLEEIEKARLVPKF